MKVDGGGLFLLSQMVRKERKNKTNFFFFFFSNLGAIFSQIFSKNFEKNFEKEKFEKMKNILGKQVEDPKGKKEKRKKERIN